MAEESAGGPRQRAALSACLPTAPGAFDGSAGSASTRTGIRLACMFAGQQQPTADIQGRHTWPPHLRASNLGSGFVSLGSAGSRCGHALVRRALVAHALLSVAWGGLSCRRDACGHHEKHAKGLHAVPWRLRVSGCMPWGCYAFGLHAVGLLCFWIACRGVAMLSDCMLWDCYVSWLHAMGLHAMGLHAVPWDCMQCSEVA
eukprot:363833-Chlamydomonas_euryale.AAC.2